MAHASHRWSAAWKESICRNRSKGPSRSSPPLAQDLCNPLRPDREQIRQRAGKRLGRHPEFRVVDPPQPGLDLRQPARLRSQPATCSLAAGASCDRPAPILKRRTCDPTRFCVLAAIAPFLELDSNGQGSQFCSVFGAFCNHTHKPHEPAVKSSASIWELSIPLPHQARINSTIEAVRRRRYPNCHQAVPYRCSGRCSCRYLRYLKQLPKMHRFPGFGRGTAGRGGLGRCAWK